MLWPRVRCVVQLHIRCAVFSVQLEITTGVFSWRVCSQGDFASRRRGLGVTTQRRSGRLPSVIRQVFHRDRGMFFFLLNLRLWWFFSRERSRFAKVQELSTVQLQYKYWVERKWPQFSSQLSTYTLWTEEDTNIKFGLRMNWNANIPTDFFR